MAVSHSRTWAVVVPVKPATVAKSRLAPFAGDRRPELARAMAIDTVRAALESADVAKVIAVTSDSHTGALLRELGAVIVPDEPDAGLNAALVHGARQAHENGEFAATAALSADLPALRASDLTRALRAAARHRISFVADSTGVGTTLYCAADVAGFTPAFGVRSRQAHREAGAVELLLPGLDSLRRDVDTAEDLQEALALGVGTQTRTVLAAYFDRTRSPGISPTGRRADSAEEAGPSERPG